MPHGEKRMHSNDVQVQRAGGEGNDNADFPANTKIDVALLSKGDNIVIDEPYLAYITRGKGLANGETIEHGDLIRGSSLSFEADGDVQLIVVHTAN